MYDRALLPSGMLRWCQSPANNQGSNSCINGPAEVAACYLGEATGDDSYFEKAKNLYALQRQYLYDANTGKVYDSGSWNNGSFTVGNTWVSTYNQGTFLGAALLLYKRYGTAQYLADAHKIAEWTRNDLCNSRGVVRVCGSGNDLQGFKGILMRYLRRYIVDLGLPEKVEWMRQNALQAYNNRNSAGVIWTAWWEKSAENFVFSDGYDFSNQSFGCSTAVSAAFNAPLSPDLVIKNAFETIEAENFDYLKGVTVERENDSVAIVSNTMPDYFTTYNNVDFGSKTAIGATFVVQSSRSAGRTIEIHSDNPSGALLGTAEIPSGSTGVSLTIACSITPTSGKHNICLVYKGSNFKIDSFRFTDETNGIETAKISKGLKLYPVPAINSLKVESPDAGRFFVYDAQGKTAATEFIRSGTATLDVSGYVSGIYLINIITKSGNYSAKFLKQ